MWQRAEHRLLLWTDPVRVLGAVSSVLGGMIYISQVRLATVSTGRTTPISLKEKLAMEQVRSNPQGTTPARIPKMSDTKNNLLAKDGWVKRVQNVNGVEIHYVENIKTGKVIDFKFPE